MLVSVAEEDVGASIVEMANMCEANGAERGEGEEGVLPRAPAQREVTRDSDAQEDAKGRVMVTF